MNARAVMNEFAKMRRLRILLLTIVMVVAVFGLTLYGGVLTPDFVPSSPRAWNALLAGLSYGLTMAAPLLLAVLASRQVDIEHQGNGWLLSQTSGLTAGGICRAKLIAVGTVVTLGTVMISAFTLGTGLLLGAIAPAPVGRWIGYTTAIVVVNLVLLAFHILLSARIDNQLVCLGIGLLGSIFALFGRAVPEWLQHATPWGYYALSTPADYRGDALVALTPAYSSVAVLGVVGFAGFVLITTLFDRQEA